jgi:regulator of CtrA degradation
MSGCVTVSGSVEQNGIAVCFGTHFAQSEHFDGIFREGMSLVETTAEYLDEQGRKDSKRLAPPVSIAYATESMRLTTRLLDLASWLLVQRSLKEGEITAEEAARKREGMALKPFGSISHIKYFDQLPAGLQALIRQSYALSERINQIDQSLRGEQLEFGSRLNPVNDQLQLIEKAFVGGSA